MLINEQNPIQIAHVDGVEFRFTTDKVLTNVDNVLGFVGLLWEDGAVIKAFTNDCFWSLILNIEESENVRFEFPLLQELEDWEKNVATVQ